MKSRLLIPSLIIVTSLITTSCANQQVVIIHGREYERPSKEEIKTDLDAKIYNNWINDQLKKKKWWYREKSKKGDGRKKPPPGFKKITSRSQERNELRGSLNTSSFSD